MYRFLVGVTGSVAALKVKELVSSLKELGEVEIVATTAGKYFLDRNPVDLPSKNIHRDSDEWPENYHLRDEILHIQLRRRASCLILAPLDANTLAKMANGICDNLLTSVIRAWDWTRPVILCPAMNTLMWENNPTEKQITMMRDQGATIVGPVEKRLACDDIGMGAMAPIEDIVETAKEQLRWDFPLANCNGIPVNHHPGAFGFHRRKNYHTGVDLYTNDGENVYAVESGRIVHIDYFTGPKVGHDWWEETWGVMVEGPSGVINYGEITPSNDPTFVVGGRVTRGQFIGKVKRVLFPDKYRPDIPGHSTSMLHLELYTHGTEDFADWHKPQKNPDLLDPTPYLITSRSAPFKTLTWENEENKTVG